MQKAGQNWNDSKLKKRLEEQALQLEELEENRGNIDKAKISESE